MKIRKTTLNDVEQLNIILTKAINLLKERKIDQWQNNSLIIDQFILDIKNNVSYVVEIDNSVVAHATFFFGNEPTYKNIYHGSWSSDENYGVIHKLIVDSSTINQGIATHLIKYFEKECQLNNIKYLRIDTHINNVNMLSIIKKNNFNKNLLQIYLLIAFRQLVLQ